MKTIFGIFEVFCQSMAMASGLLAFIAVCFEEESVADALAIAIVGCVNVALWCVFAFGFDRLNRRQREG